MVAGYFCVHYLKAKRYYVIPAALLLLGISTLILRYNENSPISLIPSKSLNIAVNPVIKTSPVLETTIAVDARPSSIAIKGQYAYIVNASSNTLQVFDLHDFANPILKHTTKTKADPHSVEVTGNYVYIVCSNEDGGFLQIFDVRNPINPILKGSIATKERSDSMAVSGRFICVVSYETYSLQIFDVSNPAKPILKSTTKTDNRPSSIAVSDAFKYVVYVVTISINACSDTLQVFDIRNPAKPVLRAAIATDTEPTSVAVSSPYVYVVNDSGTLQVFDINNPYAPTLKSRVETKYGNIAPGCPKFVLVSKNRAYVLSAGFPYSNGGTMQIFDVSNATHPTSVSSVLTGFDPNSLALSSNYAYVVNINSNTMQVFDVSTSNQR